MYLNLFSLGAVRRNECVKKEVSSSKKVIVIHKKKIENQVMLEHTLLAAKGLP